MKNLEHILVVFMAAAIVVQGQMAYADTYNSDVVQTFETALNEHYSSSGAGVSSLGASAPLSLASVEPTAGELSQIDGLGALVTDGSQASLVQATSTGVRISQVFASAADVAPMEYSFESDLGDAILVPTHDGGVDVRIGDRLVASIAKPWALDANGSSVPTHYEIRAGKLIQIIEPGASAEFPIVADPSMDTYWNCFWSLGAATIAFAISAPGVFAVMAAGTSCNSQINADKQRAADDRAQIAQNIKLINAKATEIGTLQTANANLQAIVNNPKTSAATRAVAKSSIATNTARIATLNAEIADLSLTNRRLQADVDRLTEWFI